MAMIVGVAIRHCVAQEHELVAIVVGAASRGLHASACCDAHQEDLRHAALA